MKDEKILDVMQMDFYSDSEDKNIDHVEEVIFIVGVYPSGSPTNSLNTLE